MAQSTDAPPAPSDEHFDRLARRAFFAFLLTFVLSRTIVFLIMSRQMPNLFFFLNGTHVHHLNYGIFLLSVVAGYALFGRPSGRALRGTALAYGFAMALTFDEFGMWLHLGGSYWQRASVDAVLVVTAMIGLLAYAPSLERLEAHHLRAFLVVLVALVGFAVTLYIGGQRIGTLVGPRLQELEQRSSP
jgi:hypothetical protein